MSGRRTASDWDASRWGPKVLGRHRWTFVAVWPITGSAARTLVTGGEDEYRAVVEALDVTPGMTGVSCVDCGGDYTAVVDLPCPDEPIGRAGT